jgi:hypothetical protein
MTETNAVKILIDPDAKLLVLCDLFNRHKQSRDSFFDADRPTPSDAESQKAADDEERAIQDLYHHALEAVTPVQPLTTAGLIAKAKVTAAAFRDAHESSTGELFGLCNHHKLALSLADNLAAMSGAGWSNDGLPQAVDNNGEEYDPCLKPEPSPCSEPCAGFTAAWAQAISQAVPPGFVDPSGIA